MALHPTRAGCGDAAFECAVGLLAARATEGCAQWALRVEVVGLHLHRGRSVADRDCDVPGAIAIGQLRWVNRGRVQAGILSQGPAVACDGWIAELPGGRSAHAASPTGATQHRFAQRDLGIGREVVWAHDAAAAARPEHREAGLTGLARAAPRAAVAGLGVAVIALFTGIDVPVAARAERRSASHTGASRGILSGRCTLAERGATARVRAAYAGSARGTGSAPRLRAATYAASTSTSAIASAATERER